MQAGNISIESDGSARLTGEMTFKSTPALFRAVEKMVNEGQNVTIFDLQGVSRVDSSGLALLLEWQATALPGNRKLCILNAPASLLQLAQLCEAGDLLDMEGRNPDGHEEAD
jgi:phospholipid transport system transporter-binding protein